MGKILMQNPNEIVSNKQQESQLNKRSINLQSQHNYGSDDFTHVTEPTVTAESIQMYKNYIYLPDMVYEQSPTSSDLDVIEKYIKCGRY